MSISPSANLLPLHSLPAWYHAQILNWLRQVVRAALTETTFNLGGNVTAHSLANDHRALIDSAPIFGITPDGLVNEWNMKAAEITGIHTDEVMGRRLVDNFIQDEHRAAV